VEYFDIPLDEHRLSNLEMEPYNAGQSKGFNNKWSNCLLEYLENDNYANIFKKESSKKEKSIVPTVDELNVCIINYSKTSESELLEYIVGNC
jgi:hypothetical protein